MSLPLPHDEEILRLLFTKSPLPMWVYDVDTLHFLAVNEAAVQRYGYSPDEFLRMRITDLRAQADRPESPDHGRDLRESTTSRHRLKDGRVVNTRLTPHAVYHNGHRAALVIAEEVEEWHRFFTLSLELLCIARFDGYFIHLNPMWERTLGFTLDELKAQPFIEFVHPDDRDATIAEAARLMKGAETVSFQNRYRCKDGTYRWFVWSAAVSVEEQLYYAVARDVTERKRAEDQLKESEERTRLIVDCAHDAYIGIDANSVIIEWNRQAEVIFGWSRQDAIGRRLTETIIPPQHRDAHVRGMRQFHATGEGPVLNKRVELTALHRDGHEFPVELTITPLRIGDTHLFSAFLHDISERKQTEATIVQAKEEAERASRAKSEFLSRMSHELRTPLNAIIGFSDLLLERAVGDLTAKQAEFLGDIRDSGLHLLTLINEILDLSKIEAGRLDLYLAEADLMEVVQAAMTALQPLIEQKRLAISTVLDPRVAVVRADKVRLKQILHNLLSNAVKFTPAGGHVRVEGNQVNGEVELAVVDTGPGIALDDQQKLFREFVQLQSGQQSGHAGTGLGLALVRRLVELHGGRVWVESEVGKGSRFIVRLPLKDAAHPLPMAAAQVLVVEDDPAVRRLLAYHLTEGGYRTEVLADGAGLIDKVKAIRPTVICLDIRLPGVEDWEVLRRLKEDPVTAPIPIVVVTMLDDAHHAFALGAASFLHKPIRREELLDAVAKAIRTLPGTTSTVLIVDDDPRVLTMLSPMLTQAGYRTLTASGGQEGIALTQRHLPHIIVLDLMMPEVSGFQVISVLRADVRTRGIPIVVLTAKDLTSEERAFLAQQVQQVTQKSPDAFQSVVREVDRVLKMERADA